MFILLTGRWLILGPMCTQRVACWLAITKHSYAYIIIGCRCIVYLRPKVKSKVLHETPVTSLAYSNSHWRLELYGATGSRLAGQDLTINCPPPPMPSANYNHSDKVIARALIYSRGSVPWHPVHSSWLITRAPAVVSLPPIIRRRRPAAVATGQALCWAAASSDASN